MNIAVEKKQLELLKRLMNIQFLKNYYLVGGTNLAIRYKHRLSIDLDLFTKKQGSITDSNLLNYNLKNEFKEDIKVIAVSDVGVFCIIKQVKVDFINEPFDLLKPIEKIDNFRLVSQLDIGAMKISAIIGRGTKKDFYDIYELLHYFNLEELVKAYQKRFLVDNTMMAIRSLQYFNDAEIEGEINNTVITLNNVSWEKVKNTILKECKKYLKNQL
jgi:predicted nucleotidyltransferase component of viral defense system